MLYFLNAFIHSNLVQNQECFDYESVLQITGWEYDPENGTRLCSK